MHSILLPEVGNDKILQESVNRLASNGEAASLQLPTCIGANVRTEHPTSNGASRHVPVVGGVSVTRSKTHPAKRLFSLPFILHPSPLSVPPNSSSPLVEAGRYPRLPVARERGLVVGAMSLPYWIEQDDGDWVLFVEEKSIDRVRQELDAFEAEEKQKPPSRAMLPTEKIPTFSLYVAGWILVAFFLVQRRMGQAWTDSGAADGAAILRGEWWRTITALTLHADGPHLLANLVTGLLFAMFVIPRLGSGGAWLAILVSGAIGNALNAWGYRGESHSAIGASTACFGALGLLVGLELIARWKEPGRRNSWQLVLPIGAGLALLAYLGAGDEGRTIDYMAHGWGFVAGLVAGMITSLLHLKERMTAPWQRLAGMVTLALLAVAWALARSR
jgi:membrane associated rhomboid family serine protease